MKCKIMFIFLLFVGSLLIAEKMPKKLVSEEADLSSNGQTRYWEFIIPNSYNYIEIECISSYGLTYAVVVPTKKDAFSFCRGKQYHYILGTQMSSDGKDEDGEPKTFETYYKKLTFEQEEQGEPFYFCVYSDMSWYTRYDKINKILVEITAY